MQVHYHYEFMIQSSVENSQHSICVCLDIRIMHDFMDHSEASHRSIILHANLLMPESTSSLRALSVILQYSRAKEHYNGDVNMHI